MRLIILINYRNVYCWYKMFYNYFKILFPPFMKKKAFVMVTVWCSGQINTRFIRFVWESKDKSFWKQTGITHFTSRASIHRDHIPQSRFSQHTHTPNHKNVLDPRWRPSHWPEPLLAPSPLWCLAQNVEFLQRKEKERDHGDSMSIWHIQRSKNLRPLLVFETWENIKQKYFRFCSICVTNQMTFCTDSFIISENMIIKATDQITLFA